MIWLSELLASGCRCVELNIVNLYLQMLNDKMLKPCIEWNLFKMEISTQIDSHELWGLSCETLNLTFYAK